MYENEPKIFFNQPLSGCVGVIATLVLASQIFSLFFTSTLLFYIFEIVFCFFFVFVLSLGVRKRRLGFISTYCLWLCVYIFWVIAALILIIYDSVFCNAHPDICLTYYCGNISNCPRDADDFKLHGGNIVTLVLVSVGITTSILLACIQLRFCFLLYKFIQQERRSRGERQVTYQTRPANSPPQYSQEGAPCNLQPWPEKPPGYAEALSAQHSSPVYTPTEEANRVGDFAVTVEGQTQRNAQEDSFEISMTSIDLNETPVLLETPIHGENNSIVSSEVSNLSVTNPFKDEIERSV